MDPVVLALVAPQALAAVLGLALAWTSAAVEDRHAPAGPEQLGEWTDE